MAPRKLPKTEFDIRFEEKLEEYRKNYRVDELNDANDRTLLHIMIKTELMIEDLQSGIRELMTEDIMQSAGDLKKLSDLLRDSTNTITTLQKTLAIDRKTRKDEESSNVIDYINSLRRAASDFVDERLVKMYCPTCNVMVGRFSPVHGHTALSVSFQCSQCKKMVRIRRDERDTMYDIKASDRQWREAYRAEIVQPKRSKRSGAAIPEDLGIENEDALILEPSFTQIEVPGTDVSDQVQEDITL